MPTRAKASGRSIKTPKRGISDRALIRELFIERVPLYPVADALRLTRTAQDEVDAAIASGGIETEAFGGHVVIPWDDVARLALDRWTPRMINGAVGSTDRLSVVPLPADEEHQLVRHRQAWILRDPSADRTPRVVPVREVCGIVRD